MTKAVFFGSSTVEGTGASAPDRRFSTIVCQTLGWEEVNLGIGGTTMTGRDDAGMLADEESGIGRVPDVLHASPNWVLIMFGANDFAQSKPLGDPRQFQQGTFYWDYDTVLRGLIENLPDAEIVPATLLYRADGGTPNAQGKLLADYNAVIHQLANRYRLRLADADVHSGINVGNFETLSVGDGAHLNDDGYQRLAAFFIECFQTNRCDG